MDNAIYYIVALVMLIVGITIIKKVAGCLIRSVVTIALMAVLAFLYYKFFR